MEIENVYFLNVGMKVSYTVRQYSKKSPINNFAWIEDTSQFNENSIKNYNEESNEGCLSEFNTNFYNIFYFTLFFYLFSVGNKNIQLKAYSKNSFSIERKMLIKANGLPKGFIASNIYTNEIKRTKKTKNKTW